MFEYKPHIPETVGELWELLGSMMLLSPTFEDKTGYFPTMSIDTEFFALNEGLKFLKPKLGNEKYEKLVKLSDRMRRHFEADPEDKTDDSIKGRVLIREMEQLLKQSRTHKGDRAPF